MLDEMAAAIHRYAISKGFWEDADNPKIWSEKIALIMSEGAEILEERRSGDEAEEELECADVIIRVLDYAAARGFSMDDAIDRKMAKNWNRPYLHGRQF
jgi:NTP pyrophosphatase (non-canonical NTP hydrolase)